MLKTFLVSLLVLGSLVGVSAGAQILPVCRPLPGTPAECQAGCQEDCLKTKNPGTCATECEVSRSCSLEPCGAKDLLQLAVNIYNFLLGLAGMIALLMLVWAGLRMFYWSYMEDADSELQAAKRTLTRTIAGLAIILLAYVIVNTLIVLLGGGGITEVLNRALKPSPGP